MPNIVTNQIKLSNARNFLDSLFAAGRSIYLMLGRPQPWQTESRPPAPEDAPQDISKYWDESIALKRILPIDARPVVSRINWTLFQIYDEYSHDDPALWDKRFYVMNGAFNVYKCIDNNNRAKSTIEPTGQSLNIFRTSDGYKWKYLYNIGVSDRLRFLTRNWMPVSTDEEVVSVALNGAIENVKILNGGSDYSGIAEIRVVGDGENASLVPKQRIGVINDTQILNPGRNYRYATASIIDNTGQYASIKPILSPPSGHGGDTISELGAYRVMLNVRTEYAEGEGDIPPEIKFRRICLVKDPLDNERLPATSLTYNSMKILNLKDSTDVFVNGEYIEGSDSKATAFAVVSNVFSGNGYIKFIQSPDSTNFNKFRNGEIIVGKTSGAAANIISNTSPEVSHDSGKIIYVENRTPVSRFPDQAENLHLVIEF